MDIDNIKNKNIKDLTKYLKKEKIHNLHNLKLYLDDLYYNTGKSELDDWRYDILKDILLERDPGYIPPVGAKIREHENRVEIPYWLGSADKYTPGDNKALQRWIKKNPSLTYMCSDKLDGVSCLCLVNNGNIKLFTRGDGKIGADISYLAQYFSSIPKKVGNIAVRGELIIKKDTFEKKYKNKTVNERKYKNARNMVAGLINAKTVRKGLKDIDFVAYEIVGDDIMKKQEEQFADLLKMGFKVVRHELIYSLNIDNLVEVHLRFKEKSEYEIDGIIVQANNSYMRNMSGNPKYMFAFKMMSLDNIAETKVLQVEWNVSKWGSLKPVVIIDPVDLSGVTISRATAHNAKYIEANKIGPGSIIKVTRSKDVIPFIIEVVKKSTPSMPNISYNWDENHVNIYTQEFENIMCIKLISSFFNKLGIKHVSEQTVKKMYEHGLDDLMKILSAKKKTLLQIGNICDKSAERIVMNIRNGVKDADMSTVLGASGIFGFGIGRKRVVSLLDAIPDLLEIYKKISKEELKNKILSIEGFSNIMADKIVDGVKGADHFVENLQKHGFTFKKKIITSNTLKNMKFVMSGFRDKNIEKDIVSRGGKVVSSVSKNTTGLIVFNKDGKKSGKQDKAIGLGIPIYERTEFLKKFLG